MVEPIKQHEVLAWASSFLKKYNKEENIAEMLLQHHLKVSRSIFYQRMQETVPEKVRVVFMEDVKKHVQTGIPVQHIMGYAPFYGREFIVNESVLIPRFETEELVEAAITSIQEQMQKNNDLVVVDVGTGSGIIAITLKLAIPELTVYATDISPEALQVGQKNAKLHQADVHFLKGDFLMPMLEREIAVNMIISNPPYISYADKYKLGPTVKDFDPALALFADEEGLAAYQSIISQSTKLSGESLKGLYFEIGYNQKDSVSEIITEAYPNSDIQVLQDINKNDRIVITKW